MHIRNLEISDAPLILAWMHDDSVVHDLNTNFASKSLADCESFIQTSQVVADNMHLAIASDSGEYMGTVSLKHIDRDAGNAEFAITVRKESMGHGYAWFGMKSIIKKAFDELGLSCVYWCVSGKNTRAVRFYEKHNFHETLDISEDILERYSGVEELKWYSVIKGEMLEEQQSVAGCEVVHIKTIPTAHSGELSFFESDRDIPFDIKRIYYITKVPEGVCRGHHAHKKLKQMLFCPYGKILLILENADGRERIELSNSSIGVIIDKPTWREMIWLHNDSVLCVVASDYYDVEDYIYDYTEFKKYLGGN